MTLKEAGIQHFTIKELVPPYITNQYPEWRILEWFDIRIIKAWDWIRETRGNPIYMNTWGVDTPDWYPEFTGRGLRIAMGDDFNTSQHYFGRALDGDEPGVNNDELYEFCLDNASKLVTIGVTTIEHIDHTPTWIHLDSRYVGENPAKLKIVTP